jgi:hypothetical protein
MIIQWCIKHLHLSDDAEAKSLIGRRAGLMCNWWRDVRPNQSAGSPRPIDTRQYRPPYQPFRRKGFDDRTVVLHAHPLHLAVGGHGETGDTRLEGALAEAAQGQGLGPITRIPVELGISLAGR